MFNRTNITKVTGTAPTQILFDVQNQVSVSVLVSSAVDSVTENGRKIVKAGTPLAGSLMNRSVPFTLGSAIDTQGILLHDVDVTEGNANGTLLIWGFINTNRVDPSVSARYQTMIDSLAGRIYFLSDN